MKPDDLITKNATTDSTQDASAELTNMAPQSDASEFIHQAEEPSPGIVREFIDFLVEYRLWWLTPVVLMLLLLAGLVFLSGTAVAPFIYPMW